MLVRFDPFQELERLTSDAFASARRSAHLPLDAYRRGHEYVVSVDVPGVDPNTIEVTADKNVLTVRATRDASWREGDEAVVRERAFGTFERQLMLGSDLATDRIAARYEHGVLEITIPVAESAKPRKVEVSLGSQPALDVAAS